MSAFLLPDIQELVLRYCKIEDVKNLALTNSHYNKALQWLLFRTLKIPSAEIESEDSEVSKLMSLHTRHLYVSSKMVSPAAISRINILSALFELNLNGNAGVDDDVIALLSEGTLTMKILDVSCTDVEDMPGLAKLSSLEELYLTDTHITDEGLRQVSMLTRLQKLDLQDNSIFSTVGVSHLVSLKELRFLGVSNCWNMEASAFQYLGQITSLEVLLAFSCGLNDDAMAHLSNLKLLRKLDVGFNDISDAGVACIKGLDRLQKLCVCNCICVTDNSLPYFQELNSLERLNIRYCGFTDVERLSHIRKVMS